MHKERPQFLEKINILGLRGKISCGPEGGIFKGKEKKRHRKGTNIFVYCTEKYPNDELVMLTF